jgi:hypothetical protein
VLIFQHAAVVVAVTEDFVAEAMAFAEAVTVGMADMDFVAADGAAEVGGVAIGEAGEVAAGVGADGALVSVGD